MECAPYNPQISRSRCGEPEKQSAFGCEAEQSRFHGLLELYWL